jgi:microcystin-dependent protein
MSEAFIGEIRMFAGNFAPRSWSLCDGQLLAIAQNDTLFSLFGTMYGGDGRTTYGLPDLRGRVPVHSGTGPGLPTYTQGTKGGSENVTITNTTMASHSHTYRANAGAGSANTPVGGFPAGSGSKTLYKVGGTTPLVMSGTSLGNNPSSNQSHTNLMPTQCINYIVSMFGIFPSRN